MPPSREDCLRWVTVMTKEFQGRRPTPGERRLIESFYDEYVEWSGKHKPPSGYTDVPHVGTVHFPGR